MLTPNMSFYLALKGIAVGRVARINGAIVLSKEAAGSETFLDVVSLEDWIVLGPNRLEIELKKLGDASKLELLLAAKSGGALQPIRKCTSYEDVPTEVEFHVGPPLDAAPMFAPELEGSEEDAIRAFVVALHAAVAQGQMDAAIDMLRPRLARIGARLGITTAEAEQRQRQEISRLQASGLTLLPVSSGEIRLIPVCRGLLIRAEIEGRAPICAVSTADAAEIAARLPLTFERSGQGWVVAR